MPSRRDWLRGSVAGLMAGPVLQACARTPSGGGKAAGTSPVHRAVTLTAAIGYQGGATYGGTQQQLVEDYIAAHFSASRPGVHVVTTAAPNSNRNPASAATVITALIGGQGPDVLGAPVTPVYSSGSGTAVPVVFDDWCTIATKGTLTPGSAAVLNGGALAGGPRLASKSGTMTDGSPINCGYWVLTVPLNPAQTLTGLQVAVAASGAAIPTLTGIKAGTTEGSSSVVNIAAASVASASASAAAAAAAASLPKTGGNPLVPVTGGLLLLGGLAMFLAPKVRRNHAA